VGEAAFSHKAGQHADVVAKAPRLMEHIPGELVGNERRLILSELAGKSTVVRRLDKYGSFDKSSEVVQQLTVRLKEMEEAGYEYEAAEASFDLIVRRALQRYRPLFELRNYHLESFKATDSPARTVGRIFLTTDGSKELMGAAVGVGPVETLDYCLRDALASRHPFLAKIKLVDFAVRVLNPERATAARVREEMPSAPGYSAVRALLRILERKGHVRHVVDGPRYVYEPAAPRAVERRSAVRHLVRTFFGGSIEEAMLALLDTADRPLDRKQLEALRRRIEAARREGR